MSRSLIRLASPVLMRVHLTFHVNSLLRADNKPARVVGDTRADPPQPITVEGEQECEDDEILGNRVQRRRREYLVR